LVLSRSITQKNIYLSPVFGHLSPLILFGFVLLFDKTFNKMVRSVVLLLLLSVLTGLASAGTSLEGLAFLAVKEKEEGVVKLPSGLL
jgi:hypothetical protein